MPRERRRRYTVIQWLTFQVANVGPMFGQCGHFLGYAPQDSLCDRALPQRDPAALRRDGPAAGARAIPRRRLLDRGHRHLAVGAGALAAPIDLDEFPNVRRWYEAIGARPAVQRGVALLEDRMKIGNPDEKAREALFGRQQLSQGAAHAGACREARGRATPREACGASARRSRPSRAMIAPQARAPAGCWPGAFWSRRCASGRASWSIAPAPTTRRPSIRTRSVSRARRRSCRTCSSGSPPSTPKRGRCRVVRSRGPSVPMVEAIGSRCART